MSTPELRQRQALALLCLLPFALWETGLASTPAWTWRATCLSVAAALLPGLGAYWMYGWSQKVLGASRVAVALYLVVRSINTVTK